MLLQVGSEAFGILCQLVTCGIDIQRRFRIAQALAGNRLGKGLLRMGHQRSVEGTGYRQCYGAQTCLVQLEVEPGHRFTRAGNHKLNRAVDIGYLHLGFSLQQLLESIALSGRRQDNGAHAAWVFIFGDAGHGIATGEGQRVIALTAQGTSGAQCRQLTKAVTGQHIRLESGLAKQSKLPHAEGADGALGKAGIGQCQFILFAGQGREFGYREHPRRQGAHAVLVGYALAGKLTVGGGKFGAKLGIELG